MSNEVATETEVVETKIEKKPLKAETLIKYFDSAKVVCACGNTFTTGSTKPEIRVEICNNCHPFFTGQEKFVDTEGRVERFQRLSAAKKEPKAKKEVEKKTEQPKTLKEMLMSLEK
jgi:large subunit ribosomal protein L31